jgi:hypothetical protein
MFAWLEHIRTILELLYFAAGVTIAVVACMGLRQVKAAAAQVKIATEQLNFSREIASVHAKREAAKLAADQCLYFADKCVPALRVAYEKYKEQKLTFIGVRTNPKEPQFVVKDGEFANVNCDVALVEREYAKFEPEILTVINGLEYFAIPFAVGVADEEIGYRETALGFCEAIPFCMAVIYLFRTKNRGRFDSTIRLYEIWSRRTAARAAAPIMSSMQALIAQAGNDKIKPIGEP